MFNKNLFHVGKPVPTFDYDWYDKNSTPRQLISGQEVKEAFSWSTAKYTSLKDAKNLAKTLEKAASTDNPMFTQFECPIFEVNENKVLFAHFQGKKLPFDSLEAAITPAASL